MQENVFGVASRSKEIIQRKTLELLEHDHLLPFYRNNAKVKTLSRVDRLVLEMLGVEDAPALHAKASQTLWLVRWMCDEECGL
eukprot:2012723-Amphidinium_carterae.1